MIIVYIVGTNTALIRVKLLPRSDVHLTNGFLLLTQRDRDAKSVHYTQMSSARSQDSLLTPSASRELSPRSYLEKKDRGAQR